MSAGTPEFRSPIYDQAKKLVREPHFGCLEGMTPIISMSSCEEDGQPPIISGKIVFSDHNTPYDEYVEILERAKESAIPSYRRRFRVCRNDTVKDAEGHLLDATQINRLSSFLSKYTQRLANYDQRMLENAKAIKE